MLFKVMKLDDTTKGVNEDGKEKKLKGSLLRH